MIGVNYVQTNLLFDPVLPIAGKLLQCNDSSSNFDTFPHSHADSNSTHAHSYGRALSHVDSLTYIHTGTVGMPETA